MEFSRFFPNSGAFIGGIVLGLAAIGFIAMFFSKINIGKDGANPAHHQYSIGHRYKLVLYAGGIGLVIYLLSIVWDYFANNQQDKITPTNITFWENEWRCHCMEEDETLADAKEKPIIIKWSLNYGTDDPEKQKNELWAQMKGGKFKLSSLNKNSNENYSYLEGRFTDDTKNAQKPEKFKFEFYMSPNQKSYMGKMWPEGNKIQEPLTTWHCTR